MKWSHSEIIPSCHGFFESTNEYLGEASQRSCSDNNQNSQKAALSPYQYVEIELFWLKHKKWNKVSVPRHVIDSCYSTEFLPCSFSQPMGRSENLLNKVWISIVIHTISVAAFYPISPPPKNRIRSITQHPSKHDLSPQPQTFRSLDQQIHQINNSSAKIHHFFMSISAFIKALWVHSAPKSTEKHQDRPPGCCHRWPARPGTMASTPFARCPAISPRPASRGPWWPWWPWPGWSSERAVLLC